MNSLQESPARRLSEVPFQERVEILGVTAAPDLLRRLFSLGVRPGAQVEVLRKAPLGDPLEVKIHETLLSIRSSEASTVLVGG
ncbi:MAG: ferrous iron transport protein A [Armatimonadetes bacterium]|nr:ferrous iron transport protein A [Armatimonadota bacterium]